MHEAGGRIFCQLWHMGRLVHPSFLDGAQPVSASATTAPYKAHTYEGRLPYAEARSLRVDEIPGVVEDYAAATRNALSAGFDGVQIHAANGYLIDQFLRDGTNLRDDEYGGAVENRIRLLREMTEAVATVAGADRTAVRLSPNGEFAGRATIAIRRACFRAAAEMLAGSASPSSSCASRRPKARSASPKWPPIAPAIRERFPGPLVLNSDYRFEPGTGDAR